MDLLDEITRSQVTPDEAEGRVYGWLPGVVTEVDKDLMMVKARIGKQGDNESSNWLIPAGMGSVESLPEVGDPVSVDFMDGDVHRGRWSYFPQSTTKGRPTHPVGFGDSIGAILNAHAALLNKVVADLASLSTLLGTTGLSVSGAKATGTFTPTATDTMGNSKASDGSVIAQNKGDAVVSSKRTKVR